MYCIESNHNHRPQRTEQDSTMRKPDIFDEIIQCLKTGEKTGADTSMSEETLRVFFHPIPPKAAARPQPQSKPAQATPAPPQNIQGVPPAYAPDMP